MTYMNHFANLSENYRHFRPTYPRELFQFLSSLTVEHELAWDCGTGNGQAAVELAGYFNQVIATDLHQAQLDQAESVNNVRYYAWPAEKTEIPNQSVDLITIAQALHWFAFDEFYREVKRVAKPNGLIAAWCYSLGRIDPKIDLVINKLYETILGDQYWPKERRYIDDAYQTIPFPFKKLVVPSFFIEKKFSFTDLLGYLHTWSAVKEYQKQNQEDPMDLIFAELQSAWGKLEDDRVMRWPIHLLVGPVFAS